MAVKSGWYTLKKTYRVLKNASVNAGDQFYFKYTVDVNDSSYKWKPDDDRANLDSCM